MAKRARQRPAPSRRSSIRRATSPPLGARAAASVAIVKWWEKINWVPGPRFAPHDTAVPCSGKLAVTSGTEKLYHDLSTKYSNAPSYAHVDFVSFSGGGFGTFVPISVQQTPTGYKFSGFLPVCTATSICTNGQPKKWQIYIAGELNTSVEPNEMTYQYTVDLFCGDKISCTENGTFSGKRKEGAAGALDGDFYGDHAWNVKCCPSRRR